MAYRSPVKYLVIALSCIFLAPVGHSQSGLEADSSDVRWTPEDMVMAESAGQFRISPDGTWAVWVKTTADREKDGRVSNLYLTSLSEKKEIQLTRGVESHSTPRWSPDGQLIAFLSSRPLPKTKPELAESQLWVMHPFGGEPYPLTEFVRGAKSFEWINSGTIIFSAEEDPALYEQELRKKKDETRVVDDLEHTPPVRLFKINIEDKKVARLTDNNDWIQAWAVSPDGRKAATVQPTRRRACERPLPSTQGSA